jgi:PAS domain S-box-containing protein
MGQDFRDCWSSAWPVIGGAFERAWAGETTSLDECLVFLDRDGYLEEAYFTSSFNPIRDESGGVGGVYQPVTELTQLVLAERRQKLLRDIAAPPAHAHSVEDALVQLATTLDGRNLDLPFTLFYLVNDDLTSAHLVRSVGLPGKSNACPRKVNLHAASRGRWPLAEAVRSGKPVQVDDLEARFGPLHCGPYPEAPQSALTLPIFVPGRDEPIALLVAGVSSRRALDEPYRKFYDQLGKAISDCIIAACGQTIRGRDGTTIVEDTIPATLSPAAEAIRESEYRFRLLSDNAPVMIWMSDTDKLCTWFSKKWLEFTGRSMEQAIDNGWAASVHADDFDRCVATYVTASDAREPFSMEYRFLRHDGVYRWVLDNGTPYYGPNEEFKGYIGSCTDITDRKHADVALRESEARFARFMQHLPGLAWIKDGQGRYVYANDAATRAFQRSRDELYGKTDEEIFPADVAAQFTKNDRKALTEAIGIQAIESLEHEDGVLHHSIVSKFPIPGPDGKMLLVGGMAIDVSERKQAEEALRAKEAELELVANTTPLLLTRCSRELRYRFANRAYAALFGLKPEEMIGKPIIDIMGEKAFAHIKPHIEQVLRGDPVEYETEIEFSGAGLRWYRVNYLPDRDANGDVTGWFASIVDITQRKRVEHALRLRNLQQQAIAALGDLALRESDLQIVLDEASAMAADTLDVEFCRVFELQPGGDTLLLRAGIGWNRDVVGKVIIGAGKDSQAGYTLLSGSPVVVPDFREEKRFTVPSYLLDHGVVSGMTTIIHGAGGTPWGVLGVDSTRQLTFSENDVDFLAALANVLGNATQRRQAEDALLAGEGRHLELSNRLKLLLDSTSHLIETLKTEELLPALLDLSREVVAADAFSVWRVNGDGVWRIVSSHGLSDEFLEDSIQIERAAALPAEPIVVQPADLNNRMNPLLRDRWDRYAREGIMSLMILPLRIHGQVSGTLVFYCRQPHHFTDIEVESARALANISAAAITTSELYESQSRLRKRAEEAAVRESFLATAGVILSESLDYEVTLANVARAAVPYFADWCGVDLLDDDGVVRRLAVAHVNPEKVALAQLLHEKYPEDESAATGVQHVIRTGEPEMVCEISDAMLESSARDEDHLRILRALNLSSYICVPLRAGVGICGAITFVAAESGRQFQEHDFAVAQEIAFRAGQAMDNARLYRHLQQSEERYRAIVESQTEMVCRFRPDGSILFVNGAYARSHGMAPETLTGANFWEFIAEEDRANVRALLERLKPGEAKISVENRFATTEGMRWTLWTNHALAFDENGRATEVQSSGIDITERKKAEEALRDARDELEQRVAKRTMELRRRAEQLARLTSELTLTEQRERQRLAHVLHDHLQQLLVGAKLRLDLLLRSSERNESTGLYEVSALIDDAIGASRSLTIELAPPILHDAGLAPGLVWLARWMQEKHGLIVSGTIDERAVTDREDVQILLFQSVRELLFNVVKHAGVHEASLELALLEEGNLQITVSDRGKGFDPALLLNESGKDRTGLGLFSIRERLSLLGGRLDIESATGAGSRFVLVAPVHSLREDQPAIGDFAADPAETFTRRTTRARSQNDLIRVLLVDDHEVLRQGLASLLSDEPGILVAGEAADGEQAISEARALNPDVILMDYSMPRMDGVEATRRIKAEMPHVKVVGLSIYEQSERAAAMIDAGASAYHTKGSNTSDLIATIRSVCECSAESEEE